MTNAEQVREMCRAMRGIALNYPAGLQELRRQLDTLEPPKPARTELTLLALTESQETVPAQTLTPNSALDTPRRGPGRPRKVQG